MGANDVTLYAMWDYDDTYNLSLRDVGPAGGLVFYINTNEADVQANGWKYMSASSKLGVTNWGFHGKVFNFNRGIGYGKTSTLDLINEGAYNAAIMCVTHSVTTNSKVYANWYLPSLNELQLIFNNLKLEGVGEFDDSIYSSSSDYSESDEEIISYYTMCVNFANGDVGSFQESLPYSIVAVRYF